MSTLASKTLSQVSNVQILKPENVDTQLLTFTELKTSSKSGRKAVYVHYNGNRLTVQLPKTVAPFGVSNAGSTRVTLDLSVKTEDLQDILKGIDTLVLQKALECQKDWFGAEDRSLDELTSTFKSTLRYSNPNYPPTMPVRLLTQGKEPTVYFDKDKKQITDNLENFLVKRCQVKTIVELVGMWVQDNKFGMDWRAVQVKVWEPLKQPVIERQVEHYAFVESDDEEEEEDVVPE